MGKEDTQFKPGVSGNPSGRRALTPEEKAIKKITQEQYIETMEKIYALNSFGELRDLLDKIDELTPFEAILMRQWYYCAQKGDPRKFEHILSRLIGVPTRHFKLTGNSLMDFLNDSSKDS